MPAVVAMTVGVLRRVPAGGRRQAAGGRRQAAGMDTKEFDEVFAEIVVNPVRDEEFRTADVQSARSTRIRTIQRTICTTSGRRLQRW
jgi:hypothetical protein